MAIDRIKVEIEGMSCGGCASKITSALQRDPRISAAVIDFATHSGVVEGDISRAEIEQIVKSVGYKLLPDEASEMAARESKSGTLSPELARLIPSLVLGAPVVVTAMGPWTIPYGDLIQLVFTTVFLAWPASGFFLRAFKQLRHGYVTMDTLVALGTGSAWVASIVMVMQNSHHLYFETAVLIGFFVLLGKALEDQARRKSIGDVDRLVKLRPRTVWRIDQSGAPIETKISDVVVGDELYVRPGDMLAADGVIKDGEASFDESVITGESVPVVRSSGDLVPSGSINAGATGVVVKVTRVGKDTTVEQIIQLIEDARLSRPPIQKLADQISSVFVPVVIFFAIVTWIYWWQVSKIEFSEALMRGLSVLVVACPCALGLATPVAWVAGLGRAAKLGVLVRSYEALETLRRTNAIIFDKTGTLTYGKPTVLQAILSENSGSPDPMGEMLSALSHSSHPLARSIASYIKVKFPEATVPLSKLLEEKAGAGVRCEMRTPEKSVIKYGRPSFVVTEDIPEWHQAINSGNPVVAVSRNEKPMLLFELSDAIREDAQESLSALRSRGIDIYVASGDKESVVEALSQKLRDIKYFKGSMTPSSKKDLVEELRHQGKIVAFVGDGINDAPALASADVGISLATGTDVAAHSAGLVLQRSGLKCLLDAIDLSSRVTKIIRENFFWAFFYNVAAIPVAMAGLITPMWAAGAMAMSSVSVVTNALRLRR